MQLLKLKDLLRDYPLNSFVGTPKSITINHKQLSSDMEKAFSGSAKAYLYSLSDLIAHNNEFLSDNVQDFSTYLSRLIGATYALKDVMQIEEDMANIFESELNWAQGLATRSMITILDGIIRELTVIRNQAKSPRIITRLRDKTYFVIWQKVPQIFNILSTIIAIELKQISPNDIVLAIGKGIRVSQTC
jgi:hypothetical protein